LILETFQAGLSWYTVLSKRENFRKAFDDFDWNTIAHYSEEKMAELAEDSGIIRNKLKIKATVTNAQAFLKVQERVWNFFKIYLGICKWKTYR
jgi:DNA-3-methyladenine glycosylase I